MFCHAGNAATLHTAFRLGAIAPLRETYRAGLLQGAYCAWCCCHAAQAPRNIWEEHNSPAGVWLSVRTSDGFSIHLFVYADVHLSRNNTAEDAPSPLLRASCLQGKHKDVLP